MKNNKIAEGKMSFNNANSPTPIIFRSRNTPTKICTQTTSRSFKIPEQNIVYTVEYCINRLINLINRNVPLSKNCAAQIKQYLLMQRSSLPPSDDDEHFNVRQKTEDVLTPITNKHLYCQSALQTDSQLMKKSSTLQTGLSTPSRKLKKRPIFPQKKQSEQGTHALTQLKLELQKCKEELFQKQTIIDNINEKVKELQKSQKQVKTILRSTLIEKLQAQYNFCNKIEELNKELKEAAKALSICEQQLKTRENEIFYLWQAQLKAA